VRNLDDLTDPETLDWLSLTPAQRFVESQKLWVAGRFDYPVMGASTCWVLPIWLPPRRRNATRIGR
jgi:hypothetical protein